MMDADVDFLILALACLAINDKCGNFLLYLACASAC